MPSVLIWENLILCPFPLTLPGTAGWQGRRAGPGTPPQDVGKGSSQFASRSLGLMSALDYEQANGWFPLLPLRTSNSPHHLWPDFSSFQTAGLMPKVGSYTPEASTGHSTQHFPCPVKSSLKQPLPLTLAFL